MPLPSNISSTAENGQRQNSLQDVSARFGQLQRTLAGMYQRIFPDRLARRTIVVVPSLTLDPEELAKIDGAHHYEERMLCLLMLLQLPNTRLIYVTSQPISQTVVDYFLHLLPGIPSTHARRRLHLFDCCDASSLPLVQKILDRPRLIDKIREAIPDTDSAHISCFNSTPLERDLALQLGIPLYANDPDLAYLGSKSGSRKIMRAAGISVPDGFEELKDESEIIGALAQLKERNPALRKAVIKLNEGFSGEGNATFAYEGCPDSNIEAWVQSELPKRIKFEAKGENWKAYVKKFIEMRGIVEAFVEGEEKCSPSVQCRINPIGEVEVISTHDQILGGPSGQIFLGCTFPARSEYRVEIQEAGRKVGVCLRNEGVLGRFGIDFISVREPDGWKHYAIEINLRKGGTTHPFMMLQLLTNGSYDSETGEFVVPGGGSRCYIASDNLCDDSYRGLCPEDLIDIAVEKDLHFHSTIQQGVVFHLIGALSEFGKLGVLCIGDSREDAQTYYEQTLEALKRRDDATND